MQIEQTEYSQHMLVSGFLMLAACAVFTVGTVIYHTGGMAAPTKALVDLGALGSILPGLVSMDRVAHERAFLSAHLLQLLGVGGAASLLVVAAWCPLF